MGGAAMTRGKFAGVVAQTLNREALCGNPSAVLFDNEKRLMTVQELAVRLNVSRASVYRLMAEFGLPRFKVGRAVRFRWEEVEHWLSRRSHT